jgi:hypothetical protein
MYGILSNLDPVKERISELENILKSIIRLKHGKIRKQRG